MIPMRISELVRGIAWLSLFAVLQLGAQSIDSVIVVEDHAQQSRGPMSVTDEIQNPAERAAFAELLKTKDTQKILARSRAFLDKFPQSAFLAPVAERAARASFDLGDLKSGLEYAHLSLTLLPENPLLLVAVADVEAHLQQNDAAISTARDALDYLDRFGRPAAISAREWPAIKRKQQASAWFAIGRGLINEAVDSHDQDGWSLLTQATSALLTAQNLNPEDTEIAYLLGLAYRYANDLPHAVQQFSMVYRAGRELSSEANGQLQAMYAKARPAAGASFDDFVRKMEQAAAPVEKPAATQSGASEARLGGYAGSEACATCHADVHRQWADSGMARMLRPYQPKNVIGDFEKNNEFFVGDDIAFKNGKVERTLRPDRAQFARMVIHNGRHFFEIKQSDGIWHSYPVDYTIGSKWQQAYVTKLSNGQLHVFPIQYNLAEKKWLNYWKIIDAPGSERSNPLNWEKLDPSTNYMITCAVCHTSQLSNSRGGGFEPDNLVFREPGVNCEMCHGPSADHIKAVAGGKYPDKNPLDPPVEFNRIGNRDFVAICGQCHMQSNLHADSAQGDLNYSTSGTFFRKNPELPLGEYTRATFFNDGRFRQTTFMVEALERSQCFRKGKVSCGTCHDPHSHDESSNLTSLKFRNQPDLMCTGCHTQFQGKESASAHTHHPFESEASRCVSCHMPRIMDAVLARARYHQIDDIPNAEMTQRFGQEDSPNACLLCHTEKNAQWVETQLKSWKTGP